MQSTRPSLVFIYYECEFFRLAFKLFKTNRLKIKTEQTIPDQKNICGLVQDIVF